MSAIAIMCGLPPNGCRIPRGGGLRIFFFLSVVVILRPTFIFFAVFGPFTTDLQRKIVALARAECNCYSCCGIVVYSIGGVPQSCIIFARVGKLQFVRRQLGTRVFPVVSFVMLL